MLGSHIPETTKTGPKDPVRNCHLFQISYLSIFIPLAKSRRRREKIYSRHLKDTLFPLPLDVQRDKSPPD